MNLANVFLSSPLAKSVVVTKTTGERFCIKGIFNSKIQNAKFFRVSIADAVCSLNVSKLDGSRLDSGDSLVIDGDLYFISNLVPNNDFLFLELCSENLYGN